MTCPHCHGSGWVEIIDYAGNSALRACECRKKHLAAESSAGTPLTEDVAFIQTDMLCGVLEFSPQGVSRAVVSAALMKMCSTQEQLVWLVHRAAELYTKWPGIPALRQILCSRFRPKDGIELSWSETFPDGLPDSKESPPDLPALPPGHVASIDPGAERAVTLWAEDARDKWKELPHLSPAEEKRAREFAKELEDVITAPGERALPPPVPVDLLLQEMSAYRAPDLTDGRREIALLTLERWRSSACVRSFVEQERMVLVDEQATGERKQLAERAVKRLS